MEITEQWLKQHSAFKDGIVFFKANKLEGIDSKNILEAKDTYFYYLANIKAILSNAYRYDKNDNVIEKIDSEGEKTIYKYDKFNNCISEMLVKRYKSVNEYDRNDICKTIQTPVGDETTFIYGNNGLLLSETYKDGSTYTFTYDIDLNLISEIGPHSTKDEHCILNSYKYDEYNNCISRTTIDGGETTYKYLDNNLISFTRSNGVVTEFDYLHTEELLQIKSDDEVILELKLEGK